MSDIPAEAVRLSPERVIEVAIGLYDGPRSGASAPRLMAKAVLANLTEYGFVVASPDACPSAAPESTQSPAGASVAPVYPPDPVNPAETLSALRDRYAAALAATCKLHEIEGECPACERRLTAVLAVRDDELARLRREVGYVAHTGEMWRQLWERVDGERSDALVRAEQAEAAIGRVRALTQEAKPALGGACTCPQCEDDDSENCARGIRWTAWDLNPADVIAALDGAGAVSEEQTGDADG